MWNQEVGFKHGNEIVLERVYADYNVSLRRACYYRVARADENVLSLCSNRSEFGVCR